MPHTDLDPRDPSAATALKSFLGTESSIDADAEPLLRRIVNEAPDEGIRAHACVVLGTNVRRQGRQAEAESLYREGLAMLRGSGSLGELRGCVNYALTCLHAMRVLEALVLARRAETVALRLDEPFAVAVARGHAAGALIDMGEHDRARAVLDALEGGLASLGPIRRTQAERRAHAYRLEIAAYDQDAPAARRARAGLANLGFGPDPRAEHWALAMEHMAHGRAADAVAALTRARGAQDGVDRQALRLELLAVQCLVAERAPDAMQRARQALEQVAAAPRDALTPGVRMRMAEQLAQLMRDYAGRGGDAHRAYEVAGAAAAERLDELEHFLRDMPSFLVMDDDMTHELHAYRARLLGEHRALLAAYGTAPVPDPKNGHLSGAAVCVCAWCESVRLPDGIWLPAEHAPALRRATALTHGMCTCCRRRYGREAPDRRQAAP